MLLAAAICGPAASTAERLKFRCDELEQQGIIDDVYCTVSHFYVNVTTVVDVDVYPMERSKLRILKFHNSHMLSVPAGLMRLFVDVRDMDISQSEVTDISRGSFEGAKHLVYLNMSHNNISELRASIFVEAMSLFMLDLSHNRIATVDKFAFVNAQSMSRLMLAHNRIGELPAQTFREMKFLEQIFLNDNQLVAIDSALFANNIYLQKIVIDNNRILTLDMAEFTKCVHLELIQVSGNRLSTINATMLPPKFKTLAISNNTLTELYLNNNMEVLEASNNRIRSLVVDNPLALRTLLLANNSLVDITNVTDMENLEQLDLSQNHIGRLNISSLARLKSLTLLNLAQTELQNLNYGSFAGQRDLKSLDLSYNMLNEIHLDILSPYMARLERLHLDGNNLTEVGGLFNLHVPSLFPILNTLGISNNNFNCSYLTKVLRTLSTFKIRLPVDPEPDGQNSTHVSGIACSIETAGAGAQRGVHAHFAYQRSADAEADGFGGGDVSSAERAWSRQKYVFGNDRQYGGDVELRHSHQSHEQLLRDNLFTLKLIVALIAMVGLTVVTLKCVTFYRKNRLAWPVIPSMYRSTTTMNTLQCSMEATP